MSSECPPGSPTVRACYQSIFANFEAQYVTGVRFMFGLCGGGAPPGEGSTPLIGCGSNYSGVSGPAANWTANLQNFYADLKNAGILNITPTMALGDFGLSAQYLQMVAPPQPPALTIQNDPNITYLEYIPTEPFGRIPCTNTPPYYCTSNNCNSKNAQPPIIPGVCDNFNAGYPYDDHVNGYNQSPANPIFVGWQNIYNVVNTVLQLAQSAGLTVFEFEPFQEIDTVDFPVEARFVVDNADTQTGNGDVVDSVRYYMNLYGYDTGRVAWSTGAGEATSPTANCVDAYSDYARLLWTDSMASAIGGGYIGIPQGLTNPQGLGCGGSVIPPAPNFQMPVSHTQPDIVDLHEYACMHDPTHDSGRWCYSNDAQASVQTDATTLFGDVPHYLALIGTPSALFMVGETHSNAIDSTGVSCEIEAPFQAAFENVAAYNQSSVAGQSVVFRPWYDLVAPNCASFSTSAFVYPQQVNANNAGPYKPSQQ